MLDLIVTGTDTGVGKTVIAAAAILALRERGARGIGFKPVETGIDGLEEPDSAVLRAASGVAEPLAEPLLRLAEPLAPAVAAERAGQYLDPPLVEARFAALRAEGYSVVVEGAGGVLVPLAWSYTIADMAVRLSLPVLIVARAGLGTINHTRLTVEALRARGTRILGVVVNGGGRSADLAEETNPTALARLLPELRIVVVPRQADSGSLAVARRAASAIGALLFPAAASAAARSTIVTPTLGEPWAS